MTLALIDPHEHGAGFEVSSMRGALACQGVQECEAFAVEASERLLLQLPRNHSAEQMRAQARRRLSSEYGAPAPSQRPRRKRADASDLGLDCGRVHLLLSHGYAPGAAARLPELLRATIP